MKGMFFRMFFVVLFFLELSTGVSAATLWITNTNDTGAGSLRDAVALSASGDTIRFNASLVAGGSDTINLTTSIASLNNLVLVGLKSAAGSLYISGQNNIRIFNFGSLNIVLDSMLLINGRATTGGAVLMPAFNAVLTIRNCLFSNNTATQRGGALHFYSGELNIENSTFANNTSNAEGGAVYHEIGQSCNIYGTTFQNNSATKGGAVCMTSGSTAYLAIASSQLNSNQSSSEGGAIFYEGRYFTMDSTVVNFNTSAGGLYRGIIFLGNTTRLNNNITNSIISQNNGIGMVAYISLNNSTSVETETSVSYSSIYNNTHGGIVSYATTISANAISRVIVAQSTITGNGALTGNYVHGGIYSVATLLQTGYTVNSNVSVTNSTIANNLAPYDGSGVYSVGKTNATTFLTLKSCIVSGNSGVGLFRYSGTAGINSSGYNIFSESNIINTVATDQLGVSAANLNLNPLGYYGGFGPTMMPGTNSVAINTGTPTDNAIPQSGAIQGGRRDVGAAENIPACEVFYSYSQNICSGDSVPFKGSYLTIAGVYRDTIPVAGCDSIITLSLSVNGAGDAGLQWAKSFSGTGSEGRSLAVDASGNVITTGWFEGSTDFNPGSGVFSMTSVGTSDIFIAKQNASGNFVWAKQIGNTGINKGVSITSDTTGNIYVAGTFFGTADFNPGAGVFNLTSAGDADVFVLKLDASGNFVWAKQLGSNLIDAVNTITLDASENVFIGGGFQGTGDFDPGAGSVTLSSLGNYDIFVAKLNTSGNLLWVKQAGAAGTDLLNSISVDALGNMYATGHFSNTVDFDPGAGTSSLISNGSLDVFVWKLSSNGNFIWVKQIGSTQGDYGSRITTTQSGYVHITGQYSGLTDFDPGVGVYNLNVVNAIGDFFVLKLDTAGSFVWAYKVGGSTEEYGNGIVVDRAGNVLLAGSFSGSVDFDSYAGVTLLSSAGSADIFLMKLNAQGRLSWAKRMGSTFMDRAYDLQIDNSSNLYITGQFWYTVDFDPGAGETFLTAVIASDAYVAKFGTCCVSSSATITASVCAQYTSPSGNYTWTTSGIYYDTIPNASGCDSLITIQLTITQPSITTINQSICQGQSFLFDGINRTTQGVYYDTLVNVNGCDSIITLNLTVNVNPIASISPATVIICNGISAMLAGSGGTTYAWSNSLGNNATVNVSPTVSTTYTVTVTNANSCSATASRLVTVNDLPAAAINGPTAICSGLSTTLTASGGTSYNWNSGLGAGATKTVSPASTTTYIVTVTDGNGCSATASQTVSVTTSPTATISGAQTICAGEQTTLSASGGNTYQWANGLGTNATIAVSPATTTVYSVTVSIGANCTATANATVTVHQAESTSISETICAGSSYLFNGVLENIPGIYKDTLQTIHGCDSIITLQLVVNTPLTGNISQTICSGSTYSFNGQLLTLAGVYVDTLQNINGCDSVVTLTLAVQPLPQPVIMQSGDTLITQIFAAYQWLLNDSVITNATTQQLLLPQNGNYTVLVTDTLGCANTSAMVNVTGVSISEVALFRSAVFPNPAQDVLNVVCNEEIKSILVTDVTGRTVVNTDNLSALSYCLSAELFAPAVYFIHIKTPNGKRVVKEFVKQ